MILLEHADDASRLGVLRDEGWEEQRVFPSMVAVEGHAETVAEEQEVSRSVRDISAVAGCLLCRGECETKPCVCLEEPSSPCDEPGNVAHATISVRAFISDRLVRAPS